MLSFLWITGELWCLRLESKETNMTFFFSPPLPLLEPNFEETPKWSLQVVHLTTVYINGVAEHGTSCNLINAEFQFDFRSVNKFLTSGWAQLATVVTSLSHWGIWVMFLNVNCEAPLPSYLLVLRSYNTDSDTPQWNYLFFWVCHISKSFCRKKKKKNQHQKYPKQTKNQTNKITHKKPKTWALNL